MSSEKIFEELTEYYAEDVKIITDSLIPSLLAKISYLDEAESFTEGNIIYSKSILLYKKQFPELDNYNVNITFIYTPSKRMITDFEMNIKTTRIQQYISGEFPFVGKPARNTGRGEKTSYPMHYIQKTTLLKLADECYCPTTNIFIIPFYYIKAYNELDTFVDKLYIHKTRQVKHR